MDVGIYNVDTVFIYKGSVRSFPRRDSPTAGAESNGGLLYPCGTETVEKVGLACYFAIFEISVS